MEEREGSAGSGANPFPTSLPLSYPLEELVSPVWLLDDKGAVVGANRAARQIEREAGAPLPLHTPGNREILAEGTELSRALVEGRPLDVVVRVPPIRRHLRVILEPLRDEQGTPHGALLVAPEAARAGRARSLFARVLGAAARELQTPLTALASFTRLAERAAARENASGTELYLRRVDRHVRRQEQLVGAIRELVEVMSGDMPLHPEPFDLADAVRRGVDEATSWSREHVFEIKGPAEAVVVADRERMMRVIAALLSNAVRFSPNGGRIEVRLTLDRSQAELAVADEGDGIPADRLADLFDGPCWGQEAPPGGLGLSLYLAREVIEGHRGTMWAERPDQGGTRVGFRLPRLTRGG